MRKITTIVALAAFVLAIGVPAVTTAAIQEQEPQEQVIEGSLQAVDLEAMSITVADSMGDETTVAVSDETTVIGPGGELTVADLAGKEGSEIVVRYEDAEGGMLALSIELVA